MIVSLKKWRPVSWPTLAWKRAEAQPKSERPTREKSDPFAEFEKLATYSAYLIINNMNK